VFQTRRLSIVALLLVVVFFVSSGLVRAKDPHPSLGSYVDETGTIVVDGKRFFPFGFYGVNWREPFADRMTGLRNIADAGFNTMLAEDISTNEFGSLLDEADRLNVKMLVGFPSLSGNHGLESVAYMQATIARYKSKPAVLGWSLFDDSDDGRLTFDSLGKLHAVAKSSDADHITFSTLTGYYEQRRLEKKQWIAASDSSGLQVYPVQPPSDYFFAHGGNPLTESFHETLSYVVAAEELKKPMIANAQTFRWNETKRYPTRTELRNMVFGQVIAGAKGIVAFDYSAELYDQKDLWDELRAIKDDVLTTLSGPVLNAKLVRVPSNDIELNHVYWEYQDACYIAVHNTSLTSVKQVKLQLPQSYTGEFSSPIARLPKTLEFDGAKLQGAIGPAEVQIYKVNRR
jgi:hypothetical protein